MKKVNHSYLLLAVAFLLLPGLKSLAQDLSNAGSYMTYIGDKEREVTKKYLNYVSAASHGKSLRKVDKLREQLMNTIYETRIAVQGVPPFKGDKSLRDASVAYLQLSYRVFNEDYGKIVNMEEIAEQSYDAMEAYLMAQRLATEKLAEAGKKRSETGKEFAAKNNINLVDMGDIMDQKLKTSSRVTDYYNKIYLLFFKCYRQESYLVEALNKGNVISIEQNKNSLLKYATEGLEKLDTMDAFDSDASLKAACQRALQFYKSEASDVTAMTDFILKKESFDKLQKSFNSKPAAKRTQREVDEYNKSVNEMNQAGNAYNKTNNEVNKKRENILDSWNNTVKKYWDNHMPYAK
ncbi:MAG TPA: hypothetical protein VIU35_07555 [Chitinophagaceae bacterium]